MKSGNLFRGVLLLSFLLPLAAWGDSVFRVEGFDRRSVHFDVPDLVARAKKGDGEAYYQLGIMFLCGHETKRNHFIAFDYLWKSHELGYGYASLLLGMGREFGGRFVKDGVAFCEDLPFRGLIAEYQPMGPWGLDSDRLDVRDFYRQALAHGVLHAQFCLDRMDRAAAAREQASRKREEDRKRIQSGDCRNSAERKEYEAYRAEQEKWRRERDEREVRRKREEEVRAQAKEQLLETKIAELRESQGKRLAAAESGKDPAELYWSACYLRAWAATVSNDIPERRVELARRSLSHLEKSAAGGHAQAEFELGRMLVGGDVGTIGPKPANRGGFLYQDWNKPAGREWIHESIEVVKEGDVKGPCFAPYVLVLDISKDGSTTNQVPVLVYRQDVKRGMELLRRAREKSHAGAQRWFEDRAKAGLPEDAPPWALAKGGHSTPTSNPVLTFRRYDRETDFLGRIYREIQVDRVTGDVVGVSDEIPQRRGVSPWTRTETD